MSLSSQELEALARFAHKKWGLVLSEKKKAMVHNRILGLRRQVDFEDVASLVARLEQHPEREIELALFDALSTNHTGFFRESAHFEVVRKEILQSAKASQKPHLRFWSAGCSNGSEPYTLGIVLSSELGSRSLADCRILATDLSQDVLGIARRGVYGMDSLGGTSPQHIDKYFEHADVDGKPYYRVVSSVRSLVSFALLNLLEPWKMKGPFDAIFCRNVMIYFDQPTRAGLARRFLSLLRPGGLLFVGTSESLSGDGLDAEPIAHGAYRRPGGPSTGRAR